MIQGLLHYKIQTSWNDIMGLSWSDFVKVLKCTFCKAFVALLPPKTVMLFSSHIHFLLPNSNLFLCICCCSSFQARNDLPLLSATLIACPVFPPVDLLSLTSSAVACGKPSLMISGKVREVFCSVSIRRSTHLHLNMHASCWCNYWSPHTHTQTLQNYKLLVVNDYFDQ